jgi:hypothetical protein
MNSQQCQTMLAALKSGCQSDAEFWAAVAELRQSGADAVVAVIRGLGTASDEEDAIAPSDTEGSRASGAARWGAPATSTLSPTGPGEVGWTEGGSRKAHWTQTAEARAGQSEVMKAWWAAHPQYRVASGASSEAEGVTAAKKRGPKPLAERTPEQQATHAAKKAAKAAAKASASSSDAEGAAPVAKPPRAQSDTQKAWIGLVSDTVKEMGAHGWSAWKDAKGVLWPASTLNAQAQHVYSDGPHAGKTASHQRGGMARASFIKSQAVGLQGEWAEME